MIFQVCNPRSSLCTCISHIYDNFVLLQALDEFVRKTFNEWTSTVDKEATRLLEIPLMRRSLDRSGTLDLNFDRLISHLLFHYSLFSYKSICLDKEFILIFHNIKCTINTID